MIQYINKEELRAITKLQAPVGEKPTNQHNQQQEKETETHKRAKCRTNCRKKRARPQSQNGEQTADQIQSYTLQHSHLKTSPKLTTHRCRAAEHTAEIHTKRLQGFFCLSSAFTICLPILISLLAVPPVLAVMNLFWFWKIAKGMIKTLSKARHIHSQ